ALWDQESPMRRRRQASGSEEVAGFDGEDRRLREPVRDRSVDATKERDVVLPGRERKALDAAANSPGARRGTKRDPDHFVVEDEHALTAEGKDVDGHLDVLQIGVVTGVADRKFDALAALDHARGGTVGGGEVQVSEL